MTRPDPGAGTSDQAQAFAGAEDAWDSLRFYLYNGPQSAWVQIKGHIATIRRARQ